jgi:hypothetical protein
MLSQFDVVPCDSVLSNLICRFDDDLVSNSTGGK